VVLPIAWLLLFAGCSDSSVAGRPKPVQVTGTVFYNSQPCADAKVVFMPQGHQYAAVGQTNSDGKFELQTFEPKDGAVPGEFKVVVSKFEAVDLPGGGFKETFFLPQRYRDPDKSGLQATVPADGASDLRFELAD
jgi:hypothetical protein